MQKHEKLKAVYGMRVYLDVFISEDIEQIGDIRRNICILLCTALYISRNIF